MKTILVDAVYTLVDEEGEMDEKLHELLEEFDEEKIVVTNANDEQMKDYHLYNLPYEVFSLHHQPNKTNPTYFEIFLDEHGLEEGDVVYFDHNEDAVNAAISLGIISYHFNHNKRNYSALRSWLEENL